VASKRIDTSGRFGSIIATPYIVFLLAFGVIPPVYAVYVSLVNTTDGTFAGIDNYVRAFSDFRFLPSLVNVGVYTALWLPMMLVGVVVLALMLRARRGRVSSAMRLVYYLPSAVTGAANVLLWLFIMDPSVGPFGGLLNMFGFTHRSDILQADSLPLVMALIAFTHGAGAWIVIVYGGLQNVSAEVIEAATVDGCNAVQLAWYIELPLIRKYLTYMLIVSIAGGIQLFVEPQLIYQIARVGQPWWSLNQLAYYLGFNDGALGVASAISVLLLVVSTIAAVVVIRKTRFFETEVPK